MPPGYPSCPVTNNCVFGLSSHIQVFHHVENKKAGLHPNPFLSNLSQRVSLSDSQLINRKIKSVAADKNVGAIMKFPPCVNTEN